MSEFHAKRTKAKRLRRQRAHMRLRRKISGSAERPRLTVYKSLRFLYAQLIDDQTGHTLAQASSRESSVVEGVEGSSASCAAASAVGKALAERAKEKGIENVVYDRNKWIYHGKIKALAEAAREGGLKF